MKRLLFILLLTTAFGSIQAQNTFKAILKDEKTKEPLVYANVLVEDTQIGASTDEKGFVVLNNVPNGKQTIIFSYVGYRTKEKTYTFPLKTTEPLTIFLEPNNELQAVTVYSTRTRNRIKEIPTKVEVLGKEEVMEETAINPGNISKLLGETSGIQVQHTSAISDNVSFRLQGLPGKYTQLLKDGFPMYGGFSSGLSLLQIPPLDLQQVEIIKGSASTLYGGDAVAGIVNLITKKPKEQPEFSIMLNQTHKGGNDISSFFAGRNGKFGITMTAGINTQQAKDINHNGFTDIPKYKRAVLSPKIFYDFDDRNKLIIGLNSVTENRSGGDLKAIHSENNPNHTFFETNQTNRINTHLSYENTAKNGNVFSLKMAYGNFERTLKTNTNIFGGTQQNIFSEASYFIGNAHHKWVGGLNFTLDDFKQQQPQIFSLDYQHKTFGIFSQDNWKVNNKFFLEPGIRLDYNLKYGAFFLPRIAAMYNFNQKFFTRLSGGLGYKLPTPFTNEAERTRYQFVNFPSNLKAEKSMGLNLDFNYKAELADELFLRFNQAFFITQINNPIIANPNLLDNNIVNYQNANGNLVNKGLNTNLRLSLGELILYVDYTILNTKKTYDQNKALAYTPQNKLTTTLAYEDEEEGWKAGLEAFYFGNQYRENGTQTPNYWLLGASVQKIFGHFTLALNVENILDVRQTRYENIVSGPINNPNFNELYAPLDGIVGNVVLKFDLY